MRREKGVRIKSRGGTRLRTSRECLLSIVTFYGRRGAEEMSPTRSCLLVSQPLPLLATELPPCCQRSRGERVSVPSDFCCYGVSSTILPSRSETASGSDIDLSPASESERDHRTPCSRIERGRSGHTRDFSSNLKKFESEFAVEDVAREVTSNEEERASVSHGGSVFISSGARQTIERQGEAEEK